MTNNSYYVNVQSFLEAPYDNKKGAHMGFRDVVRQMVEGTANREAIMWQMFICHAQAYQQSLGTSDDDVSVLERSQPRAGMYPSASDLANGAFLQVHLDDETFSILAKHVCGAAYGDEWRDCIMVICTSDLSLNESVGGGTTFINVIRDDWHNKLVAHLAEADPWEASPH